jgi:hypothetical protein
MAHGCPVLIKCCKKPIEELNQPSDEASSIGFIPRWSAQPRMSKILPVVDHRCQIAVPEFGTSTPKAGSAPAESASSKLVRFAIHIP